MLLYVRSKADRTALNNIKSRLALWPDIQKVAKATFETLWAPMSLFFVGVEADGGAASSSDDDRGHLLLLIFSEKQYTTLIFYSGRCAKPSVGQVVEFTNISLEGCTNIKATMDVSRF